MTLEQLKVLETIAKTKSIAKAGAILKKTPSTLSFSIKELESSLGLKLFDRSGYRLELTKEGRVIVEQVRETLEAASRLERTASELSQKKIEQSIEIAVGPALSVELLKGIINISEKISPNTKLHFKTMLMSAPAEDLLNEKVDLAFSLKEFALPGVETKLITKVKVLAVVREDLYKAQGGSDQKVFENVTPIQIYNPHASDEARYSFKKLFPATGLKNPIYVSSNDTNLRLIFGGVGWGALFENEFLKANHKNSPWPLVELKSAPLAPYTLDLYMMRKRSRPLGPVGRAIWNQIKMKV